MLIKRAFLLRVCVFASLCLSLLLGGCHLPSDEPCTASELTWVENMSPHDMLVNTLTPTLSWSYPDPSCHPGMYIVRIFDEDMVGGTEDPATSPDWAPIHEARTENPYYNVPASAGLQPGTTYSWSVTTRTADNRGPGGEVISWFTTGPLCAAGTSLVAPVLTYPPDGAEMYFPDTVKLHWDNQMTTCWPGGDIYLQISTRSNFSVPVWFGAVRYVEYVWIQDTPPTFENCTRYYWRVRADPAGGGEGPYSETRSFVLRRTEALCPLELGPFITLIPPEGISIPPTATLKSNANCRSGPGMDYPVLDILPPGASMEINGRDEGGNWWQMSNPDLHKNCWLAGTVINLAGDLSQVPVVEVAPPPPVPTDTPVPVAPVNCAQYNSNTCSSHPACQWDNKSASCKNR